jgi:uncharacterized integral membrane protein
MFNAILTLLFCLAIAIFAAQNTAPVQLRFLSWRSQDVSLALVIILSVAVGATLALLGMVPAFHRRRRELVKRTQELDDLRDQTKMY